MSWLSALLASAIVVVTFMGIDHPSRTITLQLFIAFVALAGMGFEWWKGSKRTADTLEAEF